jgi:hypothetical protein
MGHHTHQENTIRNSNTSYSALKTQSGQDTTLINTARKHNQYLLISNKNSERKSPTHENYIKIFNEQKRKELFFQFDKLDRTRKEDNARSVLLNNQRGVLNKSIQSFRKKHNIKGGQNILV